MNNDLNERAWDAWLKKHLTLPFLVKRVEDADEDPFHPSSDDEPFGVDHVMKVIDVEEEDDFYGVILKVREGRRVGYVPLLDVEVLDDKEGNTLFIDAYLDWHAESNQ